MNRLSVKAVSTKAYGLTKKTKDRCFIIGMLAIPVLEFLVFYVYVNFNSFFLAFQVPLEGGAFEWSLLNFKQMFQQFELSDSVLGMALKNTLLFFASGLFITFPLSFFLCYFLYKRVAGYKIFRVIFYLPCIISASVLAILFKYVIAVNGPLSVVYTWFHKQIPSFIQDPTYALGTLIVYNVIFGLGGNLVLFSGAMSNIDEAIIEAAKIDGAGMWTEMFRIVVPMMWPTMSTVLIFQFVGLFNSSGPVLLLTRGQFDTYTISYWIYSRVAFSADLNFPAAVGIFFTLIGAPIALFMRWLFNHGVDDLTM